MAIAEHLRGDRIVAAPARKTCPRCGVRTILLGKRSTFGIGYDGRLICPKCWQKGTQELHERNRPPCHTES